MKALKKATPISTPVDLLAKTPVATPVDLPARDPVKTPVALRTFLTSSN